ncbi:hypothetical protein AA958_19210 [Streptomyces sp. CNQ-509]|uniref:hypothetical protein n=1 Tax=Streptomyces sp. CNQ-509 TaxID=444103 RepID=UPI00062DCAAD|nr:hypothetical protein [Streptomyces sp. CNQ-509]AKH86897.1 hypothetical protein AA958_19210 [Streptomyces sp. CNQ-509]
MKTCADFAALQAVYEREIGYLTAHSVRHQGRPAARCSATQAASTKARMARALSGHLARCLECG